MNEIWIEFVRENEENITELNTALLELENDPADEEAIDRIFRTAHTLKGNAGAMGLDPASELAHAMEDLLAEVRAGRCEVTSAFMDDLFEAVDVLEEMLGEIEDEGGIETDPTPTIEGLRARLAADAEPDDLEPPDDGEIDGVLDRLDPSPEAEHETYFVRLAIDERDSPEEVTNGALVVEALIDAFDLLGTDPPRERIDEGEYGDRFDAVFGSAVGEAAIASALEPVDAVLDFEIAVVTDRLSESADESSIPDVESKDISPDEAQDLGVDELLGEFDEFDDLDSLVEEIDDDELEPFEDMGDAGSFDDLLDEPDDGEPADPVEVDPPADPAQAEVDDASTVFQELKEEVEMVDFDELQAELAELEFDEYEDEVDMEDLIGDDANVDDSAFLDDGTAPARDRSEASSLAEHRPEEPAIAEHRSDEGTPDDEPDAEGEGGETPDAEGEGDDPVTTDATDRSFESGADASSETITDADDGDSDMDDDRLESDAEEAAADPESDRSDEPDAEDGAFDDVADEPDVGEGAFDDIATEAFADVGDGSVDDLEDEPFADVDGDAFPDVEAESLAGIDDDSLEAFEDELAGSFDDAEAGAPAVDEDVPSIDDVGDDLDGEAFDAGFGAVDASEDAGTEPSDGEADAPGTDAEPGGPTDDEEDTFADEADTFDADDRTPSSVDETAAEDESAFDSDEAEAAAGASDEFDGGDDSDSIEGTPPDDGEYSPFEFGPDVKEPGEEDVGDASPVETGGDERATSADAGESASTVDGFADDAGSSAVETTDDVQVHSFNIEDDAVADLGFEETEDSFEDEFGADVFETETGDAFDADTAFDAGVDAPSADVDADAEVVRVVDEPELGVPDLSIPDRAGRSDIESDDQMGSVRVDVEQVDELATLVEGLVTSRVRLRDAIESDADRGEIDSELEDLEDLTGDLQETVMDVRLVPLQRATTRLPRVVRDVARELDKEVSFELSGGDVELDRSVLDRIRDPLIHLVRNAVDHGIEPPEKREALEKPREGTVAVRAERSRDRVTITVEDDGQGIDPDRLRESAIEAGIVDESEATELDDDEVIQLIFHSGLSTAEEVTDVSGRGVGMDVVQRTVEELDGSVSIDSTRWNGTTVTMTLPVSVAIAEVLFVESGGTEYGVPLKSVQDIGSSDAVEEIDGEEYVVRDDDPKPVISLTDAFGTSARTENGDGMLVRVREGVRSVAIRCDRVRDQQEVVVNPFEGFMADIPGVSGATVRGRGEVVPILDVTTL